jgi:hypothetical protein
VRHNPAAACLLATVLLVLAAGIVVSTLFALEAQRQAGDLAVEKEKSDANARRAEEKEQEATRALEEVETALIGSLLRPIGQPAPRWNNQGQNETPLDPSEIEALGKLGSLSGDRLRLRFLEAGLQTPQTADRLGRRAEWVAQAAVGLDPERRKGTEELLLSRLRQGEVAAEVLLACARLAKALEACDAAFDMLTRENLMAALDRHRDNPLALSLLSREPSAAGDRPDAAQAADTLRAVAGTTDPRQLSQLTQGLNEMGERWSTPEILVYLRHPLAGGPARRTLLDVLGQRTRREFRRPWHFLDWAAANGVDLTPPKPTARSKR